MEKHEVLESDVRTVVEEVLLGLLGELITPPPCDAPLSRLACGVSIDGGWRGQVVVGATLGLASLVAAEMFGRDLPGPPTPRDAQDALREVANIVAGNLKPLLGDHNSLGLPVDLQPDAQSDHGPAIAHATVLHGDGVLEVSVFQSV
jgi:hypothetical protein